MKRTLFICFTVCATAILTAQDYARVDASIQLYPEYFEEASELSAMIRRDFSMPEEQIRAIYSWIINHVAYEPEEYKKFDYTFKNYRERNRKEEKTRQQIIQRTVQTGKAVCEGYAMLFEKLCNDLGIPNYLVRGDIKTHFNDIGREFKNVHMWNIALIDGQPYLFDPTWGAGKYQGRFIPQPDYFYFKTPPELFVRSHFPSILADTLLDEPLSREMFASWPILIHPELTLEKLVRPRTGVLDSREANGYFSFSLIIPRDTLVSYSLDGQRQEAATTYAEGRVEFEVPFALGQSQLLIFFNDQPALAYTIK